MQRTSVTDRAIKERRILISAFDIGCSALGVRRFLFVRALTDRPQNGISSSSGSDAAALGGGAGRPERAPPELSSSPPPLPPPRGAPNISSFSPMTFSLV